MQQTKTAARWLYLKEAIQEFERINRVEVSVQKFRRLIEKYGMIHDKFEGRIVIRQDTIPRIPLGEN